MKTSKFFLTTLFAAAAMTAPAFAADNYVIHDGSFTGWGVIASTGATIEKNGEVYTGNITIVAGDNFTFRNANGYLPGWQFNDGEFLGNIILEEDGLRISDGNSVTYMYLRGSLSGDGTFSVNANGAPSRGQDFIFTGDLTGFSGDFERPNASVKAGEEGVYSTSDTGILQFGGSVRTETETAADGTSKTKYLVGAGTAYAASATAGADGVVHKISGSGKISSTSVVRYNYTGSASAGASALGVDNSEINARYIDFCGGASYVVSSALVGNNSTIENNTLAVSEGTATFTGSIENFGVITVASGAIADFSGATFGFETAGTDSASTSFAGDGTVTLGAGTIFSFESLSSGTGLKLLGGVADFGDVSSLGIDNLIVGGYELTRGSAVFRVVNDTLVLDFDSQLAYLTWAGGNGVWEVGGGNWINDETQESAEYLFGDYVKFASSGAEIALVGNLGASGISVSENTTFTTRDGETVMFDAKKDGLLTISEGKTLTIDEGVTVDFGARTALESGVAEKLAGTGTVKIDASASAGHGVSARVGEDFNGTLDWTGNFNWGAYMLGENATIRLSSATDRESSLWNGDTSTLGVIKQKIELATNYVVNLGGASLTIKGDIDGAGKILSVINGGSAKVLTLDGKVTLGGLRQTGGIVNVNSKVTTGQFVGTSNGGTAGTLNVNGVLTVTGTSNSTGANEGSFQVAHWGATETVDVNGVLNLQNCYISCKDGNADIFVRSEGEANFNKGLNAVDSGGDEGVIRIALENGGRINVGEGGISNTAVMSLALNGGTIGSLVDAWSSARDFGLNGDVTFDTTKMAFNSDGRATATDVGSTVTLSGTLEGTGTLTKAGEGTLKLTGIQTMKSLSVKGGALELSGTAILSGALSVENADLRVSGTFSVTEGVTQMGGAVEFTTALNTKTLSVSGGGTFSNTAAMVLSDSLWVSGENTSVTFGGSLSVSKISVADKAELSISSLASLPSYKIAVSGGSLVVNDGATRDLASLFTISLEEEGSISGLQLAKAADGSSLSLRAGTLEGLNLGAADQNSGVSLVLFASQAEEETELEDGYLNDSAAILLSGSFELATATKLDVSNLVFEKEGQRYALFNLGEGISADSVVSSLNMASGDVAGTFGYDADKGWVYFEAGEDMPFAIVWDATLSNYNWRADAIQGKPYDNLASRSVLFGKIASSVGDSAEVRVSSGAGAKLLTVRAGSKQTYTVVANGEPVFSLGTLNVERGTLDLQTKATVGSVVVNGGTLIANAAGALTFSSDGTIEVKAGTLKLNAADATNAVNVELTGGASLQFVNGGFSALTSLSVSGTSADKRAEIVWLDGATASLAGKLSGVNPSVDFVVESGEVAWGSAGDVLSGDFVKKGAGTFYVGTTGKLAGSFLVAEGALKLGQSYADSDYRIFAGDIDVVGPNASLYLHAANALGVGTRYDSMKITLSDGAALYLHGGGNDDTQTLNKVLLELGDGTNVATAPSGLNGSSTANVLGVKLGAGTTVSLVEEDASASISVLVQLAVADAEFSVADGATLTLSGGVSDNLSDSTVKGGLVKKGSGTLVLSGTPPSGRGLEPYSGTTKIEEGSLVLSGNPAVGTGAFDISDGASLVVRASGTTEISGGVTGAGAIVAETGTSTFSANVAASSVSVAAGANLQIAGNANFVLSGMLALDGTFGGHGTFSGEVVFGAGATLRADTHVDGAQTVSDMLQFNAIIAENSVKTLRKTGAGEIRLGESASLDGFTLTLEGGLLSAGRNQEVKELIFSGGGIASTMADYKWSVDAITVNAEGGVVGADLELASSAQQASLVLGGVLEIGASVGAASSAGTLSVDGTLNLSAKNNGVLVIGTTDEDDKVVGGGELKATTLNMDASVKTIEMGSDLSADAGWEDYSRIVADEIVFAGATTAGATTISGKGGLIVVGDKISFAESVNFEGTLSTLAYGCLTYRDALTDNKDRFAIVDVASGTTATVGSLIGDVEKIGAGTFVVASAKASEVRNIAVSEGTLRFETFSVNQNVTGAIVVSGSGVLDVKQLSLDSANARISLTDGGKFRGELSFSGTRDFASELRNSTINGNLSVVTAGGESAALTVENLSVSGTLTFGSENIDFSTHTASSSKMSGVLTLNGASPAISTEKFVVYTDTGKLFKDALSWNNFSVDFTSLGSEFVIVQSASGVEVYNSAKGEWGGENVWSISGNKDYTLDYSLEKEGSYVIFAQKSGVEGRDYDLVWDDSTNALKIVAYGTMIWNGASEWAVEGEDSGWRRTSRDGLSVAETFRGNDYAEFSFSGSKTNGKDNSIAVSGAVNVGGVVFKGADANATFTVNFGAGSSLGDYVTDAETGDMRESAISVLSGTVTFTGSKNISGDMFSGGLTIASGAGVRTDGPEALGRGGITLGGTLAFGRADGYVSQDDYAVTLSSDVETTGTGATLTADAGVSVTLEGVLSGTVLRKAGSGTLTLAGGAELDKLTVAEGSVSVRPSAEGVCGVGFFDVLDGASSGVALTFGAGVELDPEAGLAVAGGKTVLFEGEKTALNYVSFGGDKSVLKFAENGGEFLVGGVVHDDTETTLVVAEIAKAGLSGMGVSEIGGNLVLQGGQNDDGDSLAGLVVNVEDEIATVKVSGSVRDAGDSDDGKFVLKKIGAGVFEIAGDVNTKGSLSLAGGSVKIGGAATFAGNVYVASDSTLEILGAGKIGTRGADASDFYVASGATLALATGKGEVTIEGNLTVAGTLEVSGENIVICSTETVYDNLVVGKNSMLTVDVTADTFSGNSLTLEAGATLAVSASLSESSGVLTYNSSGSTVELGGTIIFSQIGGSNATTLTLTGEGGELRLVGSGVSLSTKTLHLDSADVTLAFVSDTDQSTALVSGSGTLAKRGAGTLYVNTLSKDFKGATAVEGGAIHFGGDKGSLGQSAIAVAAGAEAVVARAGVKIGETLAVTEQNGYVAKSVSGAGSVVASGPGTLVFTDAAALEGFTGTLGAREGGTLKYNAFSADFNRSLILENGGVLEVFAAARDEDAGDLQAGMLTLSGSGNRIVTLEGRALEIRGGISLADAKGTAKLTVSGGGDLSLGGVVKADPDSKVAFDISTATDFAGTLTLSGADSAHRDTEIKAGTLVVSTNASAAGTGTITLVGGSATLRFTNLGTGDDAQKITTAIEGAGTIQGDSGVLSGLNESFSGSVVAVRGENASEFTVDKSGEETLSFSAVEFSAEFGSTLVIDLEGDGTSDVTDVDIGAAKFVGDEGPIKLLIGSGRALEIDSSNSISSSLEIASGTVKVLSGGDLGTANIIIDSDAVLNVASEIFMNDVSGEGTFVKESTGMTFAAGTISSKTELKRGTLAVAGLGDEVGAAQVEISGGTLEFSKTISEISGAVIDRASGSIEFNGDFLASGTIARFSHDGVYASSVVSGSFAWEGGAGTLMFIGGGEGSVFNPEITDGKIVKSGSGKWTLTDTSTTVSSISVEANGGTLALGSYKGSDDQALFVGSEGVLEIAGYGSGSDGRIRGVITGSGTLAVSAGGETRLALAETSGCDWKLQILSGATVKSDVRDILSNNVELAASGSDDVKGGRLDFALTDAVTTLSGKTISIYGETKGPGDLRNGRLTVSGTGCTLDLRGSVLRLGGELSVAIGTTVKVNTLESVSPTSGVVNLAAGAVLEIGAEDVTDGNLVALAGRGAVKFVAGTTYVKNENAAQKLEEFNADFYGEVEICSGATAVICDNASFGGAETVLVAGTLRVEQGNSEYALKKLSGAGTLEIANSSATERTIYDGDNAFEGTIDVKIGRLVMTTTTFGAETAREISLSGGVNAGLVLSNAAATTELFALGGKNVTGTGAVYLENGEFTVAKDKAFGYASTTLDVTAGTTLALGSGAKVTSGLHVEKGATLDLTRELASVALPEIASIRVAAAADEPDAFTPVQAQAMRRIEGDFTLAGAMLANVSSEGEAAVQATGDVKVTSTAEVTIKGDFASVGSVAVVSGSSVIYDRGAQFFDESGATLVYGIENGVLVVSESVPETAIVAPGLETLWATIATRPNSQIWDAVKSLPTNAAQTTALRNFSPVSFAGILELSTGLAQFEDDLLRQRLEQRRYDRAYGEGAGVFKAFVNAIGGTGETSEGKNKRPNYDLSHYGAVAGFDALISEDFLVGASITIDKGKAKIHNGGGKHETDAARLGFYGMAMLDEVSYFGFGAGVGTFSADTKRSNALESLRGDASGTDVSLTATLGRMFVISSELGLHVSPYVGLDYTYSSFDSFTETGGSQSALDVDKQERNSLRGTVGATLNWLPAESWRFSLEAAYHHEFLDTDADVDAKFAAGDYRGMDASATAYFGGENSLSVGPRVEYRISAEWSVSAGYTFETDFKDTTTHSANVGVRCRF